MSGGVHNVTIEDIRIVGCEAGIYIKSDEGRGGVVEDISYRNIYINRTLQAIKFVMPYGYRRKLGETEVTEADEGTPIFRNIHVENLFGEFVAEAGMLTGLEDSTMENVTLKNVTIQSGIGFFCNLTTGSYENVYPSMENCFM